MSRPIASLVGVTLSRDRPPQNPLDRAGPWIVLGIAALMYASGFSWLSVVRHQAFQSHAFDLGNMDQAVWNTLHGHLLRFTDMDVGGNVLTTRLAIHVEPILIPLSLLYLIHSGPETLLVVQAVVVASGAVPAYLLARDLLGHAWLSLAFPLAYLLHPSLQSALLDDFHAVAMSACFLLWLMYFAWRAWTPGFLIFAVLAAATKENVSLLVASVALILWFRGKRNVAALTAGAGVVWFLTCILLIIPANNPSGHSPYLARYAYLGHGFAGVIGGSLRHPDRVAGVLTSASRVTYLRFLLEPMGMVPLLGLPVLLLAVPSLLINMLSDDPPMSSGLYQYSAEVVPFLVAAAAYGVSRIRAASLVWRTAARAALLPVLSALVLGAALAAHWQYGFFPPANGYIVPSTGAHQRLESHELAQIPPDAVVAAGDEIEPHLSERLNVYLLPTIHPRNGPPAGYLTLDASIPSLPIEPHTLHALVVRALHSGYSVKAARDGVLVLRLGPGRHVLPKGFYSFMYQPPSRGVPPRVAWGPLLLQGFTLHPKEGPITRSRPAIALDTYWRLRSPVSDSTRIVFYMSPVYRGPHPAFSTQWQAETDSPTWAWLPVSRWPRNRTVRAVSLPFLPHVDTYGKVDIAVEVSGIGAAVISPSRAYPVLDPHVIRVGTVDVGY